MDNIPTEFVCPITMEIMVHPVATRYGQNFERSALVAWLDQGADECPLTRKPLRMRDLINNHHLAQKIRSWKELQGLLLSDSPCDHMNGSDGTSDQRDKLNDNDDVLVFMYGTTSTNFVLPSSVKPVALSGHGELAPVRLCQRIASSRPHFWPRTAVMQRFRSRRRRPQSGRQCL
jgi:U-box domain